MEVKSTDISFKTMMIFTTEMINLLKMKYPFSPINNWEGVSCAAIISDVADLSDFQ